MKQRVNQSLSALVFTIAMGLSQLAAAADTGEELRGEARDAWILGKVETVLTLNSEISAFAIDTDVNDGVVELSGQVEDDIDRDLAAELARGVSGVKRVDNQIEVTGKPGLVSQAGASVADKGNDLVRWVEDATTTATVKSKLLANSNTKGLKINVDTSEDVVTLQGEVETEEEKALAAQIAATIGAVKRVDNRLVVMD